GHRRPDCDLRRDDLERAGRDDARLGRLVPLPARSLRARGRRADDGLPLHLAVHHERAARARFRLHRLRALRGLHLARADAGGATRIGVYDYLGYYDVCYIADEVKEPGRVIPRSIIWSVLCVAVIYFAINLSIIGVVPWRYFVPADARPESDFVVSIFMERIY